MVILFLSFSASYATNETDPLSLDASYQIQPSSIDDLIYLLVVKGPEKLFYPTFEFEAGNSLKIIGASHEYGELTGIWQEVEFPLFSFIQVQVEESETETTTTTTAPATTNLMSDRFETTEKKKFLINLWGISFTWPPTTTTTTIPTETTTTPTTVTTTTTGTVTLTVGDGSGLPGSSENPVVISLDNPDDTVKGVQLDVCEDGDDYLSCTACETTDRTTDIGCSIQELEGGCCRVLLFSLAGDTIGVGTGPIVTITYEVSGEAPVGECRELSPEVVKIFGEDQQLSDVILESGEFCFSDSLTSNIHTPDGKTTITNSMVYPNE